MKNTNSSSPTCPTCSGPMVLRNSSRGQFYGCKKFPRCRGTARMGVTQPKQPTQPTSVEARRPGTLFGQLSRVEHEVTGSPEQDAIWDAIQHGSTHIAVNARAGTGKSFTIFHAACRVDHGLKVGVLAFNKAIAGEMQLRFDAAGVDNCRAVTFHSLGYGAIRSAYGNSVRIDQWKMRNIAEALLPDTHPAFTEQAADKVDTARGNLARLAGLVRNYMGDASDQSQLEELADRHNIELAEFAALVLGLVSEAVERSWEMRKEVIDFDEMLYVPVRAGLQPEQFDLLMVDEAQDVNAVQMVLGFMAVKPGGRMVIVGDVHQAIYGWRGAHTQAMAVMGDRLAVTNAVLQFPLTVTRRCPQWVVKLAQCIVPDIQALPDAPPGVIRERVKWVEATSEMHAGDMVLCRVNRYLVPVAYALLRRGVKAVIRGRDIGANVTALIGRVLKDSGRPSRAKKGQELYGDVQVTELLGKLNDYRDSEEQRLLALGKMGVGRLASLEDQCETLVELSEGCVTVADIRTKISALFADFDTDGQPNNAVICSTVHGGKGLEADRVYILNPELMPHPRASRDWEMVQEHNLLYVAVTRAKRELVFVAGKPKAYKAGTGEAPQVLQPAMDEYYAAQSASNVTVTDTTPLLLTEASDSTTIEQERNELQEEARQLYDDAVLSKGVPF